MYEENYNLARDGYKGSFFPYIFFGLSGYVFLILFYGDRFFPSLAIPIKIFFAMIGLSMFAGGCAVFFSLRYQYSQAISALNAGQCFLVEGIIEDFSSSIYGNNSVESFKVSDKHFQYTSNEVTVGFNQTRHMGGVLKNGTRVRISYIEDRIVKLEIWTSP
jgi:hypothetical protein